MLINFESVKMKLKRLYNTNEFIIISFNITRNICIPLWIKDDLEISFLVLIDVYKFVNYK